MSLQERVRQFSQSLLEKNTHFRVKVETILLPEDEQNIIAFIENDIRLFFEELRVIEIDQLFRLMSIIIL